MKSLLLASLLALAPVTHAENTTAPEVLSLSCRCDSSQCALMDAVNVDYNRKTQFLEVDHPKWSYSGYVTRQVSKVTNTTYLTLPSGLSIGSVTLRIQAEDGAVSAHVGTDRVRCTLK
ncbi:MAG: hypothetical protein KF802_12190 [Bdellovibrionaceae bacterium]|nr:hypothetical protein [Pseudobdellovibrionaceae bacterium]